jgi:hypothetical protein
MLGGSALYRLLLTASAIVWLVAFGLSLDDVLRETAYSPILVTPARSSNDYPVLVGFQAGMEAERSGLMPGARILSVDGRDLQGVGFLRWNAAFTQLHGKGVEVPVVYERAGLRHETTLSLGSRRYFWPRLVASLAYALCTALLVLRVRPSELQRAIINMNVAVGILLVSVFAGGFLQNLLAFVVGGAASCLVLPLSVRAYWLLPRGTPPAGAWARYAPWPLALIGPFDISRFHGFPFSHEAGSIGAAIVSVIFVAAVLAIITRSYREADALGRRQLRWVVLGLYLMSLPLAIAGVLVATLPSMGWVLVVAVSGVGILPLCMLIAVARYNFLDVDRLLGDTASITLLLVIGAATFIVALPPTASLLSDRFGMHQATAQFLVLALLAVPGVSAYRKIRVPVDRLLFADRQVLEHGMVELNRELAACGDPETLWRRSGEGLAELYDLEACAVYARSGETLEPRIVCGELQLPRFAAGSPLVAALVEQPGPLSRDVDRGGATAHSVGPFQRAVLDTLGVPLVVPVRTADQLEGFLALGRKRSADVFSGSDLALIALVADRIASELRRFRQAGMIEAGQVLHERLRRYVPGRLAERIDRGEDLDATTRDVSILFVDIRGFSTYTEDLAPDEVFSTVNRYTELVSAIIHERGGTVVEFNGDGMMAVFGAPHSIDRKEQAAIAAGREIVARVPQLAGATGTLSVGAGVATGSAFVGSVHAADRMMQP